MLTFLSLVVSCNAAITPTHACVQVKGFVHMFKHLLFQTSLEAGSANLKIPCSLRGVPHSIQRVQPDPPPPGFFPTDEELKRLCKQGA